MAKTPSKTKAVAKTDDKNKPAQRQEPRNPMKELAEFLEGRRDEIEKLLPPSVGVDRMIKTALMAAMENEEIGGKCTAHSIYRSVMQASLMGLTVGTGYNEGYFIRYKNSCTFRASYLGWVKVAQRTDGVDLIRSSVIYANDHFEMSEHPPVLEHKPQWLKGKRGEIIGAVAVAYTLRQTSDGKTHHDMLDFAFIDGVDLDMARKQADRHKASPAWRDWPDEMRKKVAVRRLCKWLPRNEDLSQLQRIENHADNGVLNAPDPRIDDVNGLVMDARFEEPTPEPAAKKDEPPKELPEPEVVNTNPPASKPAPKKPSRADKLKGDMVPPPESPSPKGEQDDDPDYGGPDDGGPQGEQGNVPPQGEHDF